MINSNTFYKLLYDKKINKYDLLCELKSVDDIESIKTILKKNKSHPLIKTVFSINALPKSYAEIGKRKVIGFTHELKPELNWQSLQFEHFDNEINLFIKYKKEYESFFILGNYEEANKSLKKVEHEICFSQWSIENKLLLNEYQHGVKSNWETLSEINASELKPLTAILSDNFSKKAEKKISYFRFKNLLDNQLEDLSEYKYFYEYLCFRINYFGYFRYEMLAHISFLDSQTSIIDGYLSFIRIANEIISHKKVEYYDFIESKVEYLMKFITDDSLIQIKNHFKEAITLNNTNLTLNAFDLYIQGKYDDVLKYCIKSIPENPLLYELWEIYVKTLIESKKSFIEISNAGFLNQILKNLYSFFNKDDNFNNAKEALLKFILSFSSMNWTKQLYSTILFNYNSPNREFYNRIGSLNSLINNPQLVIMYEAANFPKSFIDNHISIPIIEYSLGKKDDVPSELQLIEKKMAIFYKGRNSFYTNKFEECIILLESIYNEPNLSNYRKEDVINMLFYSFLYQNKLSKALKLIIGNYLSNKNLVDKLDKNKLVDMIMKNDYKETARDIYMPILFSISEKDNYEQYVSFDVFLSEYEFERPSELIEKYQEYEKKSLIYFLRVICIPTIMHHSIFFEGTDDIEKERIRVCQFLSEFDSDRMDEYNAEISDITQKSAIRKGLQNINQGRISVNIDNIKRIEENNIKESFNRYQELSEFTKNSELRSIDNVSKLLIELINTMYGNEDESSSKIETIDPAFVSFKVMFLDLRDKFLFSKEYGLDGCLSTRIRHGTLSNQIRSVFEKEHLLTSKDKDDKYIDSEYWNNYEFCQVDEIKNYFQEQIRDFSKKIDNYNEYIRSELIQIKTEKDQKKPSALFDFSYSDNDLLFLFNQLPSEIQDYKKFLDYSFSILLNKTEISLKIVRYFFQSHITKDFADILGQFYDSFRDRGIEKGCPELSNSIVRCGTNLYQELLNISVWFVLSDTNSYNYLSLEEIIKTAVESINNIYHNRRINPKLQCKSKIKLFGDLCTNLIYINQILIENILKHSGLTNQELDISIDADLVENKYIILFFENNLNLNIDINKHIASLNNIKNNWNNSGPNIEKTNIEGGSGLNKIKRILSYDLFRKEDSFDFDFKENRICISLSFEIETY